jgi:hypothetical protein
MSVAKRTVGPESKGQTKKERKPRTISQADFALFRKALATGLANLQHRIKLLEETTESARAETFALRSQIVRDVSKILNELHDNLRKKT